MKRVAALALLVLATATQAFSQAPPSSTTCALSAAERAQIKQTQDRVIQRPDANSFANVESLIALRGCGVWSVSVDGSGVVTRVHVLRTEAQGPYAVTVTPWISKFRFQPSSETWTGLMLVAFEHKD